MQIYTYIFSISTSSTTLTFSKNLRISKITVGTLFSSRISVSTLRQISTPSSSSGRWRGKSTSENRVWSGSAKMSAGWSVGDKISTCVNKIYESCLTAILMSSQLFLIQRTETYLNSCFPWHRHRNTEEPENPSLNLPHIMQNNGGHAFISTPC